MEEKILFALTLQANRQLTTFDPYNQLFNLTQNKSFDFDLAPSKSFDTSTGDLPSALAEADVVIVDYPSASLFKIAVSGKPAIFIDLGLRFQNYDKSQFLFLGDPLRARKAKMDPATLSDVLASLDILIDDLEQSERLAKTECFRTPTPS